MKELEQKKKKDKSVKREVVISKEKVEIVVSEKEEPPKPIGRIIIELNGDKKPTVIFEGKVTGAFLRRIPLFVKRAYKKWIIKRRRQEESERRKLNILH